MQLYNPAVWVILKIAFYNIKYVTLYFESEWKCFDPPVCDCEVLY